jgi:DNA-binding response OmpR family regulator
MSIPVRCASCLRELEHQIQFWQMAAPELPVWLARVLRTAREYPASMTSESGEAARKLVTALETFDRATRGGQQPAASAVHVLWPVLEETYAAFAAAPDRENPRSLAMARHSLVNVLAPLHLASSDFLTQKLQAALAALDEEVATHPLRAELEWCLTAVAEDITPESIQFIGEVLESWHDRIQQALAPVSPRPLLLNDGSAPLRGALIVEDQWWGEALEHKARAALPASVKVSRVRTLQGALSALDNILTGSYGEAPLPAIMAEDASQNDGGEDTILPPDGVVEEERDEWSEQEAEREIAVRRQETAQREGDLLVFLDLGLPADQAALQAGDISRAHGKQLLARLRDYGTNARTIVLTSPSEYLPDHLWIAQQGIAPEDFILKTGSDWDKEVDEALRRVLESKRAIRRVELDEKQSLAWLDGIEIGFAPLDFKILSILCENLKDKPEPQHPLQRRRRPYSCADIAGRLSDYFEESCAAENIPAHIHTIRRRIHERFNEVGRSINAHHVIATEFHGDELHYRMVARQFLFKGQHIAPVVSSVTVLVVEDTEAWQTAIAGPLREAGYEVETAADVASAIAAAKTISPTVLCVDMHLPASLPAVSEDAGEANQPANHIQIADDAEGGLRVIEQVRALDAEARVVVLTDLAQHDRLRVQATRRGVWIHDYIHKADPDWLWKLHRSIWRLTREWQQGVDLSEGALRAGHVVELSRSEPRDLWVDGVAVGLSKTRARLVHALAERVDQRIAKDELQAIVYADKTDKRDRSGALTQMVNDVRKQIEDDAAESGRQVNAKHIIAEESGGYILCGPVIYRK